jgi:hypothetical protein
MELGDYVIVNNSRHPLDCLYGKIVGKRGNCAPNDLWCLVYFPARMRSHLVPESMLKLDEGNPAVRRGHLFSITPVRS